MVLTDHTVETTTVLDLRMDLRFECLTEMVPLVGQTMGHHPQSTIEKFREEENHPFPGMEDPSIETEMGMAFAMGIIPKTRDLPLFIWDQMGMAEIEITSYHETIWAEI